METHTTQEPAPRTLTADKAGSSGRIPASLRRAGNQERAGRRVRETGKGSVWLSFKKETKIGYKTESYELSFVKKKSIDIQMGFRKRFIPVLVLGIVIIDNSFPFAFPFFQIFLKQECIDSTREHLKK